MTFLLKLRSLQRCFVSCQSFDKSNLTQASFASSPAPYSASDWLIITNGGNEHRPIGGRAVESLAENKKRAFNGTVQETNICRSCDPAACFLAVRSRERPGPGVTCPKGLGRVWTSADVNIPRLSHNRTGREHDDIRPAFAFSATLIGSVGRRKTRQNQEPGLYRFRFLQWKKDQVAPLTGGRKEVLHESPSLPTTTHHNTHTHSLRSALSPHSSSHVYPQYVHIFPEVARLLPSRFHFFICERT